MRRGCFVWTPSPPLAGRRTPRWRPMCVCVCSSVLAGSGGPASRARFGAPHLFLWPLCLSALLGPLWVGLPLLWFVGCLPPPFFFPLPAVPFSTRPSCLCLSFVSGPGCLGPWRLVFLSSSPPGLCFFFFGVRPRCLWLSLVSGPGCPGPWRCVLFVLLASRSSAPRALSPLLWFPPGCWLLPGGCCLPTPLLCLAVFLAAALCSPFFFSLRAPVVSGFPLIPALGALGLGAVCCLFCWPPAPRVSVRSRLFCGSRWVAGPSLVVAAPPAPPPHFSVSLLFPLPLSAPFVLLVVRPRCPWLSPVSGPECSGPWRCVLFVLLASRSSAPRALSPLLWFLPGCWLLLGGCCPPPPPFVSRYFYRCRFVLPLFFRCAPPLSLAFSCFRPRVLWALALCAVCFVGLTLLRSPCALASFVFPAWPLAAPRWLLPPPPPLFCVTLFFLLPLCAPFSFIFFFVFSLRAPVVSGFRWFPAPGALGLGAVCCLFC